MNIQKARKKKNITQREAAELLECSVLAYGRYEREEHEPTIGMLKKMSSLYGVTVDYLIGNTDSAEPEELKENERALLSAAREADERAILDAIAILSRNKKQ